MKKEIIIPITVCLVCISQWLYGQVPLEDLHGDEMYSYRNFHSGNMIRTSFYNDGMIGRRNINPDDIGEWPINSGRSYINMITFFFGIEVKDTDGIIRHIVSEANGVLSGNPSDPASGDADDQGHWQSLAPLPGFADDEYQEIAMSHEKFTWPATWPDKFDDIVDPGWPGSWNGYFGKDILNADQESYYLMDDYDNNEFAFYPDSTDSLRRGLGLRGTVRGFQWSNVLVEDVIFWLVDVKNIGTTDHAKANFGILSGPVIGRLEGSSQSDGGDDGASYDLDQAIGWHWDLDDIGAGGWTPVGKHGFAFFESPGNPYDGIDNDGDAGMGPGPVITEDMFEPKVIATGDPIVLIDYETFERTVTTMPAEGIDVVYLKNIYHYDANTEFQEIDNNLMDDNLNGIIDESNGSEFDVQGEVLEFYLYLGRKYIDYFTGEGSDNILLDEQRDDNIDNDGDWNALTDDVGLDGVPKTGDVGEGDGVPTSGRGTDLPGEPHIDKTDIDETDMIGLTAFNIFTWGNPAQSNDEGMWEAIIPGFLNGWGQTGDTDLMLGSGFFPINVDQIERFSIGMMFGVSDDDLFTNKFYAEKTYNENYNFAKAPLIPTVEAIPGDNMVTLIWDDVAEHSLDPITGEDFEGYSIYRSTDPGWNDMIPITDGRGSVAYRKPIAQFDLADGLTGYSGVQVRGVEYYMGDDTGIVNTWTDSTARNGQTYYYAVVSYDRGDATLGVAPSECSKYIAVSKDGTVDAGKNVVMVRPESPVAGFTPANVKAIEKMGGSTATGEIGFEIVDQTILKADARYRVTFEDTLNSEVQTEASTVTKSVTLVNISEPDSPDTLIARSPLVGPDDVLPITDGFRLQLSGPEYIQVNAELSGWNRDDIYDYVIAPFRYSSSNQGYPQPKNFVLEFGEVGLDSSVSYQMTRTRTIEGMEVNFTIRDADTGQPVPFAFYERDDLPDMIGQFTAFTDRTQSDQIIVLNDTLAAMWSITLDLATNDSLHTNPQPGDILEFHFNNPFLSNDVFEFTTNAMGADPQKAKVDMDRIRVVPNPYVVANSWEPLNPYNSGRGPREIHFIHLPEKCTIKIFNIRGQLIQEIEHQAENVLDGTYIWDMLTKDGLDISYGVYIYHVDAGEIGHKVGKFAVIK